MRQRYTYIIYILLPLIAIASVAAIVVPARQGGGVDYAQITEPIAEVASAVSTQSVGRKVAAEALEIKSDVAAEPADTIRKPRYTVRPTIIQSQDEKEPTADLKNPENLKTDVYYDEETGTYRMGTKLGENFLETPFYMTPQEYQEWATNRTMREFFRTKNKEAFEAKGKEKFDFTDMKFDLGPANKVFGPGGVRIKTQGSAELKLGANLRFVDNPSLSERNRKVFGFDFDEKVNLSVNAKVGDKVNMDFSYNSEATFAFDNQNVKLHYEGKDDEIIKLLEAGNVSLPSNSKLVRGASSLFGVRADLQFGKLKVQTVISQKKSSSQTVSSKGGVQLTSYEFSADQYDENRHFFLAHYFRDKYDANMEQLPNILSGISINRIEVWVTNKNGTTNNTRNIIAFTDLAEHDHISSSLWGAGGTVNPANASNDLYAQLNASMASARDINLRSQVLEAAGLVGGEDYEKLESARLLSS